MGRKVANTGPPRPPKSSAPKPVTQQVPVHRLIWTGTLSSVSLGYHSESMAQSWLVSWYHVIPCCIRTTNQHCALTSPWWSEVQLETAPVDMNLYPGTCYVTSCLGLRARALIFLPGWGLYRGLYHVPGCGLKLTRLAHVRACERQNSEGEQVFRMQIWDDNNDNSHRMVKKLDIPVFTVLQPVSLLRWDLGQGSRSSLGSSVISSWQQTSVCSGGFSQKHFALAVV